MDWFLYDRAHRYERVNLRKYHQSKIILETVICTATEVKPEAYPEPYKTYTIERFAKTVNSLKPLNKPLNIFPKHIILDASQYSEYACK